jgi:hypothetical protein
MAKKSALKGRPAWQENVNYCLIFSEVAILATLRGG